MELVVSCDTLDQLVHNFLCTLPTTKVRSGWASDVRRR
jgi:hypothetical protein